MSFFDFASMSIAQATTEAPAAAAGAGSIMTNVGQFLPIILMVAVFYFLIIRPQSKRQKEHRSLLDSLSKGDEVSTVGGILGIVTEVQPQHITIQISQNGQDVNVLIQKHAVSAVLPKGTIKGL